jgi:hypothetical protein
MSREAKRQVRERQPDDGGTVKQSTLTSAAANHGGKGGCYSRKDHANDDDAIALFERRSQKPLGEHAKNF